MRCHGRWISVPYYFSKLFKQETGGNFIEYLTEDAASECKRTSQGFRAFHQGDLCGIRIQRPKLFQQDIQKIRRRDTK